MAGSQTMGIGELARRTGLTVRTLHHYDEIGLLVPSGRTPGGYREYDDADLDRLKQIVAYRACGLALTDIAEMLDAPGTEQAEHLRRQMALLDKRIEELGRQRAVLGRTWEAKLMGITLDPEEYFEVFGESDPRQYTDEVQERWGGTDAYAESHGRTAGYSKEDWLRAQEQTAAVEAEFGACMAAGLPPDGDRAMAAAEAHRLAISTWYYDCSHDMHVELADMYLADPRFTAHYDAVTPGMAAYVHAAIYANALTR